MYVTPASHGQAWDIGRSCKQTGVRANMSRTPSPKLQYKVDNTVPIVTHFEISRSVTISEASIF